MAFRKPRENKVGGKFLIYGATHEGKSWFALTFPKIGAIDSETGLAFEEGKEIEIAGKKYNNLEFVDTTADLDELEDDLDSILDGEVDIETLVIDSETKFYNTMDIGATEAEERKAKNAGKAVDTRSKWGRVKNINMKLQQAKISCSAKGIHIVSTAQLKEIKDKDDSNKVIGYKPDAHSTLGFDYDVTLRFYVEIDKKTKERRYFAEVEKDRTHVTKPGDIIENCTYDIWKDYFDKRNAKGTLSGANFTKDLKKSTKSVLNNSELSEELSKEIKSLLKEFKNTDKMDLIKEKIKELGIDVKLMDSSEPDILKELLAFMNK